MYLNWRLVWYVTLRINHAAKGVHNFMLVARQSESIRIGFTV